jgi:uncharacterized protein YegJ (DUF2314 family)
MKTKYFSFTLILLFLIAVSACKKDSATSEDNKESALFKENEYNLDLKDFSVAVSNALESDDFRKIIKQEALVMIDGDYDVLLKRVMEKSISPSSSLKSGQTNYTIKNLLEDLYPTTSSSLRLKSSSSIIDELSRKYPDLQISVPVHAEDWDESTYTPVVTFIPAEYDEAITKTVTGYINGKTVPVDAVNEPAKPVIVISQNERMVQPIDPEDPIYPNDPIIPSDPSNLTGVQTESGIRLSWVMPPYTVPSNTSGYYIFRKGANESSFIKISTVLGANNRSYDDNKIEASRSYTYYVIAYLQGETSNPSNYLTLTAPNFPKPVLSFDAIQNSKTEIELRWENDHSQYILETKLSKHVVGVTNDYQLVKSFTANQQDYFDHDINVGKKVIYKVNHVTSLGESNAKYDFVQVPYRDISQKSPVYIKQIKFSDWKIEGWLAGKPEFYITVTNVDAGGKTPFKVQDQMDFDFNKRSSTSQTFTGRKVLDWQPGFWFDMLTFTAIEYDKPSSELKLKVGVGYNLKDKDKKGFQVTAGADYEITFSDKGEECGNSYLNYFGEPEYWLVFPNYGVQILVSETDN